MQTDEEPIISPARRAQRVRVVLLAITCLGFGAGRLSHWAQAQQHLDDGPPAIESSRTVATFSEFMTERGSPDLAAPSMAAAPSGASEASAPKVTPTSTSTASVASPAPVAGQPGKPARPREQDNGTVSATELTRSDCGLDCGVVLTAIH